MKAQAAVTQITDPYRAGVALGEQLQALQPEVIFLFSSIHVAQSNELLQGIHDVLTCEPVLVGASGDGVFTAGGALQVGISALGLNSDGKTRWHLVSVSDAVAQPGLALRDALAQAKAWLGAKSAPLMFLFADLRVDAGELEKVLAEATEVPIIGGLAGDDNLMQGCALFANHEVVTGSLLLLVVEGEFNFSLTLGHRLSTIGHPGRVEAVDGKRLLQVAGRSAQEFVADQFGRTLGVSDLPTLALLDGNSDRIRRLRSVLPRFDADGALELYASVAVGDRVQMCVTRPEDLLADLRDHIAHLQQEQPLAALLVSCAGRKIALGAALNEEVTELEKIFPTLPLAGFPSFGEIAPLPLESGGYSRSLFHNMTFVLLLVTS